MEPEISELKSTQKDQAKSPEADLSSFSAALSDPNIASRLKDYSQANQKTEVAGTQLNPTLRTSSLPEFKVGDYSQSYAAGMGIAAIGTVGMGKFGPALIDNRLSRGALRLAKASPTAFTVAAGTWGGAKLAFSDVEDLRTSDNLNDAAKYGLASISDLTMMTGAAARFNGSTRKYGLPIVLAGIAGRATIGKFWGDNDAQPIERMPAPEGKTNESFAEVQLASGEKESRVYDVYIPKGYKGDTALPAMIVFHGVTGGDGQGNVARESGLNSLADEKQFIAIYPVAKIKNGMGMQDWNSPGSGLLANNSAYDDIDYVKEIFADLKQKGINIDERAIYAAGFSSGGAFAQHVRGRLPNLIAGVASVHGTVRGTEAKPPEGVGSKYIGFLSDSDHMLPVEGGRGPMTAFMGLVASSNPKAQVELAKEINQITSAPNISTKNGITITEYAGKYPVVEYKSNGGHRGGFWGGILGRGKGGFAAEHAWDGTGKGGWPVIGEKNPSLNVSRIMTDFLLEDKKNK